MIFPIFVISTLAELYVLMTVGGSIGAGNTVLLVIITAFIGSYLLKQQGLSTLKKVQTTAAQGNNPSFEMLEGVVIMVSGVLLLTPGFITDSIGLLGLMPWSRAFFLTHFLEKNANRVFASTHSQNTTQTQRQNNTVENKTDTIEGEFWEDKKK